jgi:hypothetical protein
MTLGEVIEWVESAFLLLGNDEWKQLSIGQGVILFVGLIT